MEPFSAFLEVEALQAEPTNVAGHIYPDKMNQRIDLRLIAMTSDESSNIRPPHQPTFARTSADGS
jgi:hypothetical protein